MLSRYSTILVSILVALLAIYLGRPPQNPEQSSEKPVIPRAPSAIVAKESFTSPLGLICHSHHLISLLEESSPTSATTLFSILHLDYLEHPFHPPKDCAYPYEKNYKAARAKISRAWAEATVKHDRGMRE